MLRRVFLLGSCGLFFCLIILPAILVRGCAPAPAVKAGGISVAVYIAGAKKIIRMGLEDYLIGVAAAEMPARFSTEALKAQAVAARTLTIRRMRRFGGRGCRDQAAADICDQPDDGQAWLSETDLRRVWGWKYGSFRARIANAVQATRGLVLLYNHRPIDAVYHSTCGGATEDAAVVWGRQIPYLIGIKCGFCGFSPRYEMKISISRAEMARRLGLSFSQQVLAGKALMGLQVLGRSGSGRVTLLTIAGHNYRGQDFRKALGLRSACFSFLATGEKIVLDVRGYGHGVGLCQYGAEGMARKGADYKQILLHYYTGVSFGKLKGD